MNYWLGVASKDHVELGIKGGFCQLNHGKQVALAKMHKGDRMFYYCPKQSLSAKQPYRKVVAVGTIADDKIYQVEMFPGFTPYRRNIVYDMGLSEVSLEQLQQLPDWHGYQPELRFGHLKITEQLYTEIFRLMKTPVFSQTSLEF